MAVKEEVDLFGEKIETKPILRDKFIEPPFTVLDTKSGNWQRRKRNWEALGIKSELGRDAGAFDGMGGQRTFAGKEINMNSTSIFDPALCEIMYTWFCEPGGKILDPFSGGSVRGIVAHYLGFKYTGIDIRQEQIDSNREQGHDILEVNNQPNWYVGDSNLVLDGFFEAPVMAKPVPEPEPTPAPVTPDKITVTISAKSLAQEFIPCSTHYIKTVCKGRCCESTNGISVSVHDSEIEAIEALGCTVKENLIQADERGLCPFKSDEGFCTIHEAKPLACKASPFILNKNNKLLVRNRYRLLRCYKREGAIPAYKAHKWSLTQIFGAETVAYITEQMEAGADDFDVEIASINHEKITACQAVRTEKKEPVITKETRKAKPGERFDFLFSCPPYADLEVYSDLPGDISNMDYAGFVKAYGEIIAKSCQLLKPGGYAVFVVGEVRDKKGNFYGFVPDTIKAFQACGMAFYNEAVLLNQIGTAMMRASNCMKNRKLVKTHQTILGFKKI